MLYVDHYSYDMYVSYILNFRMLPLRDRMNEYVTPRSEEKLTDGAPISHRIAAVLERVLCGRRNGAIVVIFRPSFGFWFPVHLDRHAFAVAPESR